MYIHPIELEAASTALPTLNDGDSNTGVLDEETPTHQSFDETFNEGVERVEETTGTGLPTEPVEVTTTTATSDYTMMTQPITSGEIVSTETTVTPPTLDERPDHPLESQSSYHTRTHAHTHTHTQPHTIQLFCVYRSYHSNSW